jgi:glycosyltransferase involved in cell wall biosynthesis
MLKDHFSVRLIRFRDRINQVIDIFKTFRGVLWAEITLSHFATIHALWAVLFSKVLRKKTIVIIAGHEVAKVPEIKYGVMLNPVKAWVVNRILKHADMLFTVSDFTRSETLKYVNSNNNVRVVYGCNAIDCNYFRPSGEKEDLVITVGFIDSSNIKRKGFETFIRAAKYLQDTKFMLLGKRLDDSVKYLESIAPANVTIGDDTDLLKWYQKAKVYCQLSYYESFGVCLVEAMSCECVPVVTNKGALPEVAGDVGFYVTYGDPENAAEAIKKALKSGKGGAARERVETSFSVEARRGEFIEEIEKLLI